MPRTKGSITCPFHKKRLVSECGCFKPYGLPEWREFTCCHCEEHVKHISQWGDMKRKPYFYASGQCIAVKVRWPQNSLTPPYFLAPLGSLSCILPHRKKRCVRHAFYSPACIVFDDFIFSPACIDSLINDFFSSMQAIEKASDGEVTARDDLPDKVPFPSALTSCSTHDASLICCRRRR